MLTEEKYQEMLNIAHEIIGNSEPDEYGENNQTKWEFIQSVLPETRSNGFFANIDFNMSYQWDTGDRLLAVGYLSGLRKEFHNEVLNRLRLEKPINKEAITYQDMWFHAYVAWFKKIKDKFEALQRGEKTWKHEWMN